MDFLKTIGGLGRSKDSSPAVKEINIYPIKSCAEIQVKSATVTPRGFRLDRVLQVVSEVDGGVWNYCTPRDKKFEKLFHVKPTLSDDGKRLTLSSPHASEDLTLDVDCPLGSSFPCNTMLDTKANLDGFGDEVAEWLGKAIGAEKLQLVGIPRDDYNRIVLVNPDQGDELPPSAPYTVSLADEAPFLMTTQESLSALNDKLKSASKDTVDMRR